MSSKKQPTYREGRPTLRVPQRTTTIHTPPKSVKPSRMPAVATSVRLFISRLRPSKKLIRILSTTGGVILVAALLYSVIASNAAKTPDFKTILPESTSISDLGGWKRISPPTNDPVFAYRDTIAGTAIAVSQQPLPKSFAGDVDTQIAELAKKFNATNKIESNGVTLYVGTSVKGPQSGILAKDGLLILIKTEATIPDSQWVNYINNLK